MIQIDSHLCIWQNVAEGIYGKTQELLYLIVFYNISVFTIEFH